MGSIPYRHVWWVFLTLGVTSLLTAQDYDYAYINVLEGSATVQRSVEPEPEEATINVPIMLGDRVWTGADGRLEIRYGDGARLRMDNLTKADFVEFDPEALVRVWNGSAIIRNDGSARTFRLDSPAGSVYPASAGSFRIDVYEGGGSMTLSVLDGLAELVSPGGSVLVRAGQRSLVRAGARPDAPFEYSTAQFDDFEIWDDQLNSRYSERTRLIEGVPEEVGEYAAELDDYGDWEQHEEHGSVWYPSEVDVSWSPYSSGRWAYTSYGYSWVSHEPWGWAPYHYGRWGHGGRGWYWIPGTYWSPAWVSWSIGPTWIGWSPLGYYDRPVYGFGDLYYGGRQLRRGRGGKAIPRSAYEHGGGWRFADRNHLSDRRRARGRIGASEIRRTASRARLLENGAILNRDFSTRSVGAAEMTRARARVGRRGTTGNGADERRRAGTRPGRTVGEGTTGVTRGQRTPGRTRGRATRNAPATTNPRQGIRDGQANRSGADSEKRGVRRRGSTVQRSPQGNARGTPGRVRQRDRGTDTTTNRRQGTTTNRRPGTITNRRPGTTTNRRPGTTTNRRQGTTTNRRQGTTTNRRQATITNRRPGTTTNRRQGTTTNRRQGTTTNRRQGTTNTRGSGRENTRGREFFNRGGSNSRTRSRKPTTSRPEPSRTQTRRPPSTNGNGRSQRRARPANNNRNRGNSRGAVSSRSSRGSGSRGASTRSSTSRTGASRGGAARTRNRNRNNQ